MLKIAIIEDEKPARKKLENFIRQYAPHASIIAEADSVKKTVQLLQQIEQPDLIFSDIELLDGTVFEAFAQASPLCPIIFATAYNQYWMNAFQNNGIEYLLKPFTYERFEQAMKKYESLKTQFQQNQNTFLQQLNDWMQQQKSTVKEDFKKRFPVKMKDGIYFLETEAIVYFHADGGVIKAFDTLGKMFLLNETALHELELKLNPQHFFRINRSEIVHQRFIKKIEYYTKDRLSLYLQIPNVILYTSQSRTAAFKKWMES